ncbi:hypothetical protein D3C72_1258170 [compost metagenome]
MMNWPSRLEMRRAPNCSSTSARASSVTKQLFCRARSMWMRLRLSKRIWLCKSASSGQPRRSASWATRCASAGS